MPPPPDPYAILGLDPRAEDVVVQAAWRALLRKYHPDTNRAPDAEARTHAINQAYRILSDPQARWILDRNRAPQLASLGLAARRRSRRRLGCALAILILAGSATALHLLAPATTAWLWERTVEQATALGEKARAWRDQAFPEHHPRPPVNTLD